MKLGDWGQRSGGGEVQIRNGCRFLPIPTSIRIAGHQPGASWAPIPFNRTEASDLPLEVELEARRNAALQDPGLGVPCCLPHCRGNGGSASDYVVLRSKPPRFGMP